jgi:hypothetical protein
VHQRRSHVTPFVSRGETSTAVFFLVAAQRRSREPREVEQQDAHRERLRSAATERSRSQVLRRSQRWFRGFRSSCNRTMSKALPSVSQDVLHTTRCVLLDMLRGPPEPSAWRKMNVFPRSAATCESSLTMTNVDATS